MKKLLAAVLGSLAILSFFFFFFFFFFIQLRGARSEVPEDVTRNLVATRPIPMRENRWLEELTWMEVRDQIALGQTTVLLPTGGIEQNGPYVITGKHNKIVAAMAEGIAERLGNALIAPVVKFVPQGQLDPPSGHMHYPGSIGLTEDTYRHLILDICRSLKLHGFRNIVLIGDSGGNQEGLAWVADELNDAWNDDGVRVIHERNYYFQDAWSYEHLKTLGILQLPDVQSAMRNEVHSDYHYEALLAALDIDYIRARERQTSGEFEINGVPMDPLAETILNGRKLMEYRVRLTAESIEKQLL